MQFVHLSRAPARGQESRKGSLTIRRSGLPRPCIVEAELAPALEHHPHFLKSAPMGASPYSFPGPFFTSQPSFGRCLLDVIKCVPSISRSSYAFRTFVPLTARRLSTKPAAMSPSTMRGPSETSSNPPTAAPSGSLP
jgi:hypothetical protein